MIGPNLQSGKKLAHRHPLVSGRARAGLWDLAVCLPHNSMEGRWMWPPHHALYPVPAACVRVYVQVG